MTSESIHDVTDVIRSAARTLHDADIDTPEHDAKLLLAEACGRDLRDIDKAMLMGEPLDGLHTSMRVLMPRMPAPRAPTAPTLWAMPSPRRSPDSTP